MFLPGCDLGGDHTLKAGVAVVGLGENSQLSGVITGAESGTAYLAQVKLTGMLALGAGEVQAWGCDVAQAQSGIGYFRMLGGRLGTGGGSAVLGAAEQSAYAVVPASWLVWCKNVNWETPNYRVVDDRRVDYYAAVMTFQAGPLYGDRAGLGATFTERVFGNGHIVIRHKGIAPGWGYASTGANSWVSVHVVPGTEITDAETGITTVELEWTGGGTNYGIDGIGVSGGPAGGTVTPAMAAAGYTLDFLLEVVTIGGLPPAGSMHVETYGVQMDSPAGVPLYGDRSAWDAAAYPAKHANNSNTVGGLHHTLGTGAGQAAAGDHDHDADYAALAHTQGGATVTLAGMAGYLAGDTTVQQMAATIDAILATAHTWSAAQTVQSAYANGAQLIIRDADSGYFEFLVSAAAHTTAWKLFSGNASSQFDFDWPELTSGAGVLRLGRNTTTSGAIRLEVHKGNGASTPNHRLTGNGSSYLAANNSGVGVGMAIGAVLSAKLHVNGSANEIQEVVQANSTQTENLSEWRNSAGSTLAAVGANGSFKPSSMADGTAPNNAIYYSTTQARLVYKDSAGGVHPLY